MKRFLHKSRRFESLKALFGLLALAGFFLPWMTVRGCSPKSIADKKAPPAVAGQLLGRGPGLGFTLFPEEGAGPRVETYDGWDLTTHNFRWRPADLLVLALVAGFPLFTVLLALYLRILAPRYYSFFPVFQFFFGLASLTVAAQACVFVLLEEKATFHLGIVLTGGGTLAISVLSLYQMIWILRHAGSRAGEDAPDPPPP